MKINKIKSGINNLNIQQRQELIDYIRNSYSIFTEHANIEKCPVCLSENIVRNGIRNNINRFICKDCKKSFTFKTNTVISGIKELNKWNLFVEDFMTLNIPSIEFISKKLGISKQTAMDWRHKLLSALVLKEQDFSYQKIEFDESWYLISRKGRRNMGITDYKRYRRWREHLRGDNKYNVKILFTYGRDNNKLELYKSHMGRTSADHLKNYFVPNRFNNITAYTDTHRSYASFFNENNIPHQTFISTDHVNPANREVHNQYVNSYCSGFRKLVNHTMRGVSSKYIDLYAKWYQFIVNIKKEIQRIIIREKETVKFDLTDKICDAVLSDYTGLEYFRQSEFSFVKFLKANGRTNFENNTTHYYIGNLHT